jgi:hypothetical protein
VLGPLPTFYKALVSLVAFGAFVGLGSWAAWLRPDSTIAEIGTSLGVGLGVATVLLLLIDPGQHDRDPRVRVRAFRR